MKLITTAIFLFFVSNGLNAQRYLTEVFPILDSTMAGIFGSAVNVQGQNQNLMFDFYEPAGDIEPVRPFILYIHGGGFTSGTRDYPSVKSLCRTMAKKGYTVATIDYRLDPNFDIYNSGTDRRAMTDAMHDAKQAIRYFKANAAQYKIDTNKFYIGGESAGGATAMLASYVDKQSELTSYPMTMPNNPIGSSNNSNVGNGVQATMCLCGLLLDTNAMESTDSNPLLWVHSTDDNFVPIALSFQIVLRASNLGIPLQTKVYGGPHCPWYFGNPNWSTYLDSTVSEITDFLYPIVTANLSVNEINTKPDFKIYPNPSSGIVKIESKSDINKVEIIDALGQIILTGNKKIIDGSKLKNGLYTIHVFFNDSQHSYHRLVIFK